MNRIYKVIWSKIKQSFVVVSECSKTQGKGTVHDDRSGSSALSGIKKGVIAAVILLAFGGQAFAEKVYVHVNTGDTSQGAGNSATNEGEPDEKGGAQGDYSIAIGLGTATPVAGESSIAIGKDSGSHLDTSYNNRNIAIGEKTGWKNRAQSGVAIGTGAGQHVNTGDNSVSLGSNAGSYVVGGTNVSIGKRAGNTLVGEDNVAIGSYSGKDIFGGSNISLGSEAGVNFGEGSLLIFDHYPDAQNVKAADNNISIGKKANNFAGGHSLKTSNNIAMGLESKASGKPGISGSGQSIAIGTKALAEFFNATALGTEAQATAESAVAIGKNAQGKGVFSISIGQDSQATEDSSVALGSGTNAQGEYTIALGNNAQAVGESAVAMGSGSHATAYGATALGNDAHAVHNNSVALGKNARTKDYASVASAEIDGITYDNFAGADTVTGVVSVGNTDPAKKNTKQIVNVAPGAIDENSTDAINGSQLFAVANKLTDNIKESSQTYFHFNDPGMTQKIGDVLANKGSVTDTAGATGSYSVTAGVGAKATGEGGIAIGYKAKATGTGAVAIGGGGSNIASGRGSAAIGGEKVQALGDNSIAMGKSTKAGGINSTAMGSATKAEGVNSVTMGYSTTAKGGNSIAIGSSTMAEGMNSAAMGGETTAKGDNSIAMGYKSEAIGAGSLATGGSDKLGAEKAGGKAYTDGSMALGTGTVAGTDGGTEQAVAIGYDAQATANNSLAIGFDAIAERDNAVAIGIDSDAKGDSALALGNNAKALQDSTIVLGKNALATEQSVGGVAIGSGANSNGVSALALGNGAWAVKDNAVALGNAAKADGTSAVAMGSGSLAEQEYTVALGNDARATVEGAVAIGKGTSAIHVNSVALGRDAKTKDYASVASAEINGITYNNFAGADTVNGVVSVGNTDPAKKNTKQIVNVAPGAITATSTDAINGSQLFAVAKDLQDVSQTYFHFNKPGMDQGEGNATTNLGRVTDKAGATGEYSITAGVEAKATGRGGIAIGYAAEAAGERAVVIGGAGTNTASGTNSVAMGAGTTAEGQFSTAMGSGTIAGKDYATALGGGTKALGEYSTAIGRLSEARGNQSIAMGNEAKAIGNNSLATGTQTEARGDYSTAMGAGTTAEGDYSTAMGLGSTAKGDYSTAMGYKSKAIGQDSLATQGGTAYTSNSIAIGEGTVAGKEDGGQTSVAIGYNSQATAYDSLAIGFNAIAKNPNSVALGQGAETKTFDRITNITIDGVTYGNFTGADTVNGVVSVGKKGAEKQIVNVAPGAVTATSTDAINGSQLFAVADKLTDNIQEVSQTFFHFNKPGMAQGDGDAATNLGSITDKAGATGEYAIAAGINAAASGIKSVAIGLDATASAGSAIALGDAAEAVEDNAIALGNAANAKKESAVAIGAEAKAEGVNSVAIGYGVTTEGQEAIGIGVGKAGEVKGKGSLAMGSGAKTKEEYSIAIGRQAEALEGHSTAIGIDAKAEKFGSTAIGEGAEASQIYSTAIGIKAKASGDSSTAMGRETEASGISSIAMGYKSKAIGVGSLATGGSAETGAEKAGGIAYTAGSMALGAGTVAGTDGGAEQAVAIGYSAQATANNSLAIGFNARATDENSVALGEQAETKAFTPVANATINGVTYDGFAGTANGVVSVGKAGFEKQIVNVAPGAVDENSTDAINGSQLFAVANKLTDNIKESSQTYFHFNDPDITQGDGNAATNLGSVTDKAGATGDYSITAGVNAKAGQEGGIAIGHNAEAAGLQAVVIGGEGSNTATGTNSVAMGNSTTASGSHSTAMGNSTTASGSHSTAMGNNTTASGNNSVAMGSGTLAEGGSSLATGEGTKALGPFSTAMGKGTTASGYYSTALGEGTTASGYHSTALGEGTTASGNLSVAMGKDTTASGSHSVAMGKDTTASGSHSTAMGNNTMASGDNSVAMGDGALAEGTNSLATQGGKAYTNNSVAIGTGTVAGETGGNQKTVAIGYNSQATANNSLAIGFNASATDENSIALGEQAETKAFTQVTTATVNGVTYGNFAGTTNGVVSVGKAGAEKQIVNVAPGAIAEDSTDAINGSQLFAVANKLTDNIKESSQTYFHFNKPGMAQGAGDEDTNLGSVTDKAGATGNYAVTAGVNAKAGQEGGIAIGHNAEAAGRRAVVIGGGGSNTATGVSSVAMGKDTTASGHYSTALGEGTTASGANSIAMGNGAKAEGNNSLATGNGTEASGHYSTAMGKDTTASGHYSTALGEGTTASGNHSTAMGKNTTASNNYSTALGERTTASGNHAVAMGNRALAEGNNSLATQGGKAYTNNSIAIGTGTVAGETGGNQKTVAIGYNSQATANNSLAVGFAAMAAHVNSVALGQGAQTKDSLQIDAATVGGITYSGFAGTANGVVSVGKAGFEKQIVNVAPGAVDENSTDAINGSQLFAVANKLSDNIKESSQTYFHFNKPGMVQGAGDEDTNLGSVTDKAGATGNYSVTAGVNAKAGQEGGIAIGHNAKAAGLQAVVIGGEGSNTATGTNSLATGYNTTASGIYSTATGYETIASGDFSITMGRESEASGEVSIATGYNTTASGGTSTAMGNSTKALANLSTAMGHGTTASGKASTALGNKTEASGDVSIAMGHSTVASGSTSTAMGHSTVASGNESTAMGNGSTASGAASTAMGYKTTASGDLSTAMGNGSTASGVASTAMGAGSQAEGDNSLATQGGIAHTASSIAIGGGTVAGVDGEDQKAVAIGYGSKATADQSLAIGFDTKASHANSVALGQGAETKAPNQIDDASVGGISYGVFAGTANGVVSIGKGGAEKQIVNVAPGIIDKNSTDAINGSQLFATQTVIGNMANSVTTVLGGDAALAADGAISMSDIGGTGKDTIHEAIKSVNTSANAGFTISGASPTPAAVDAQIQPGETLTITGAAANTDFTQSDAGKNIYTIVGEDDTVTIGLAKNLEIESVTTGDTVLTDGSLVINSTETDAAKQISLTGNGLNNGGKQITNVASGGDIETNAANIGDINSAISDSSWQIAGNDKTAVGNGVNPGEQVNFLNGNATTVTVAADGDDFTVAYDINVDNKTVEIAGEQIKAKTTTLTPQTNGKITADNTEALATADSIADAINKSGFTVKANGETGGELITPGDNVDLVAGDHMNITRDGSKFTFTADTQGLVEDAQLPVVYSKADGTRVYKRDGKFYDDPAAGTEVPAAEIIASMQHADGTLSTPTRLTNIKAGTEDADAVTISQLKGAVTALGGGAAVNADGTVNAPTYTVTDGNPSTGGTMDYTTVGAALTGLNTAVNQPITFKADTNSDTGSNGSQQQLGSEFSILSGDLTNPAFTGSNLSTEVKDGQVLIGMAKSPEFTSIKLKDGANETELTTTAGGLDIGGDKITNIAAGDISATSTDAVNGSQLFAATAGSKEEVTSADKSITIATMTNGAGANIYDLKVQTDAATLKFVDVDPADPSRGKQLSAVTSNITSSPAGVAAADMPSALVTAGDVASAINTSGFTAKANGDSGKLITSGDEVDFINGDNIEITRDGGQFTVKTAKDVSFDSVTTGDTVVNNNGVTISNGAAGSAVILSKSGLDNGGNKITNIAAGDISATSTDAVNGSQLFAATAGSKEEVTSTDKSITIATTTNGAGANVYDLSVNTDGTTIAVDSTTGAVKAITDSIFVVDGKAVAATSTSLATSGDIAEAINKSGFTVKANGDAGKLITAGDSVEFNNGDNIRISRTDGQITVGTAKDVSFDSVTTGDTEVTTDGITINGGAAGQSVTLGKSGLDNGGNKITNIAAGEISATSTDAVNGSQVFALAAGSREEVKSADQSVTITTTQNAVTGANIYDLQIQVDDATMEFVDVDPADPAKGKKLTAVTSDISNDATGVATAAVGSSLTTAGSVAAAINNAGWVGTAGAGIDGGIVQGAGDQLVKTGEKVTFDAGKNIKLVQKGQTFTYATRDNVEFTKVTTGDTVMTSSGVTAPSYTTNGKHTVTISGDSGTINGLTNTTFDSQNYTSGQAATEDQLASVDKVAHAGFNVSANGRNPGNIGPGETIDFNNRDGNVLIQNNGNTITFNLNPDLHVNSVTTGNTQINTNGLFIKGGPSLTKDGLFINGGASVTKDGFFVDGGPSVTKKGIDAAGKPIANVARGTHPGDAVNLSQLEEAEAAAAKGTAAAMAAASMPQVYAPGSSMLTAGASTYRGESAIAVGYSTMSDNGKWILQGNASANEDDAGFSVGVGYQW